MQLSLQSNRFEQWFNEYMDKPFVWGESDCCLVVCDYVEKMTGIDPAENHRGKYSTAIGSKRALTRFGTVTNSFDRYFKRIHYNFCKRGDVVMFKIGDNTTLGIKWSGCIIAITEEQGLTQVEVDISQVLSCWSIYE